jgi:pimeloyl-ACP methyl ester carboxylesterase
MAYLWLALKVAAVGYAVIVALLYFQQGQLIFVGARGGSPAAAVALREGAQWVRLRAASGGTIAAVFGAALTPDGRPMPDAEQRSGLLFFYGNGSSAEGTAELLARLRRLGVNVLVPDYPGYGCSEGSASEEGCYQAADTAYDWLLGRAGGDSGRILIAGHSLGGGVAVDLASRKPAAGLALFNTFTSVVDMASREYPWVPVRLLLRHRFESDRKIARVHCPILLVQGDADELIPPSMTERLVSLAGGPVTRVRISHAGHNDLFDSGGEPLWSALRRFVVGFKE